MAKIYISSTFLDLEEFREKILFHLQKMKQVVAAMEYYLADDRRPAAKCIADVNDSDIYVGIFAWRYGTIPDDENPEKLSITEMEYQTARKKGIPCLIFLQDGKSPWSPDLVDDDKTHIKVFRKKVEGEQTAQWFKNPDELASLVGASLYDKLGYGPSDKSNRRKKLLETAEQIKNRANSILIENEEVLTPLFQDKPNIPKARKAMINLFNKQKSRADFSDWVGYLENEKGKEKNDELRKLTSELLDLTLKLSDTLYSYQRTSGTNGVVYISKKKYLMSNILNGNVPLSVTREFTETYLEFLRDLVSYIGRATGKIKSFEDSHS